MPSAVIGALRVTLGADTAAFEKALTGAQRELMQVGKRFEKVGASIGKAGRNLTMGVTVPLLALGAGAVKAAAQFESAMIKVGISTQATAGQMKDLQKQAREIGKNTVFSASEAADAMDMLAKNGLETAQILGGAAKATVDLAAATGSELEPAAAAVTDTMQQFHKTTADLPDIVNRITGAVNLSKFSFDDFRLAMGQAGGVAGGLGVSFEDFTTALAATSALFASGSDAGTSFKTFLQRMIPATEGAATAMAEANLRFFEADGSMRPLIDIAENLKQGLAGLSDEAKNNALKEIFGTDAMRTAIALMDQGAEGIRKVQEAIEKVDARKQALDRMKGLGGALEQMKGAWEDLGIALGDTGALDAITGLITGVTDFLTKLSEASPTALKFAIVLAAITAAVGPLLVVLSSLMTVVGGVMTVLAIPAVAAALPVLLAVTAAVAALGAAFYVFRDDIGPILSAFWEGLKATMGPLLTTLFESVKDVVAAVGEAFAALVGDGEGMKLFQAILAASLQMATRILSALAVLFIHTFQQIANVIRLITALLKGDWSGAWKAAKEIVSDAMAAVLGVIEAMVPGAVEAMRRLFTGVKTWLVDKFTGIVDAVKAKIEMVKGFFFGLYDAVVGHSYIPDMVEGIASWMAKLEAGMVEPAKSATEKTAEAFRALRDEVGALFEGLMSDEERFAKQQRDNVALLDKALKANIVTVDQRADALDRMKNIEAGRDVGKQAKFENDNRIPVDSDSEIARAQKAFEGLGAEAKSAAASLDDAADAFGAVGGSLDDVLSGLQGGDWKRAAGGFVGALDSIKKAFAKGSSTGDKVGGAAAIADSLGQAIGGSAGGALSGAANMGMAAFMATGNPLIAAGAAVVGGIMGAITGGKARKAEKEAARLKQREEELTRARELAADAAQRLADIEAEHASLTQRLLEVSGDSAGAKRMAQEAELAAALDDTSRGMLRQIHAWEAYNDQVAAAAAAVEDARADLTAAYEREKSAIDDVRDKFQGFVDGFKAFRQQLEAAAATMRGPSALTSVIGKRLADTMAGIRKGDEKAFEALQSVSEQFLDASLRTAATSLEQRRQLALVRASVEEAEGLASHQVDLAVLQLNALNAQVAGLITVDKSVNTVAQAVDNLRAALSAQMAVTSGAPPAVGGAGNPAEDPWSEGGWATKQERARGAADAASGAWGAGVQKFFGGNARDYILHTWETRPDLFMEAYNAAKAAGQPLTSLDAYWQQARGTAAGFAQRMGLEVFNTGGSFKVGGNAGIDRNIVSMGLSRGEHVNVSKEDVMADNNAVLRELVDKVELLTAAGVRTAVNTGVQRRLLKRWDGDGQPPVRDVG